MAPFLLLVPLSFCLVSSFVSSVAGTCYFPDGSITVPAPADDQHAPCTNTSAGTSVCCVVGFQCLSNGYCNDYRYDNFTRVLRGACTDQNWGAGCPTLCKSVWPQGDEIVYTCGGGQACCGVSNACCNDNTVPKWFFGNPQTIAIAGQTIGDPSQVQIQASPVASSVAQSAYTSMASNGSGPTATSMPTNDANSSSNNTVAIGVGIGVGAGVLLLVSIIAACWYVRRRRTFPRKSNREIHEAEGSSPTPKKYGRERTSVIERAELPGSGIEELPSMNAPEELQGHGVEKPAIHIHAPTRTS